MKVKKEAKKIQLICVYSKQLQRVVQSELFNEKEKEGNSRKHKNSKKRMSNLWTI